MNRVLILTWKTVLSIALLSISTLVCSNDSASLEHNQTKNQAPIGFYTQKYSTTHLRKHPNQTVKQMAIAIEYLTPQKQKEWSMDSDALVEILVKFKNNPYTYLTSAWCRVNDQTALECYVDGDGGNFTITRHADNLSAQFEHLRMFRCDKDEEDIHNGKVKLGISGLSNEQKYGDDSFLLHKTTQHNYQKLKRRNSCL